MPCWSLGQSTGTRTGCFLVPRFQATKVGRLHPPFPVQALMGSWGDLRNHYLHSLGSHFQNMVSTLALFITVIYWTLFHRSVIEAGFLKVLPFLPQIKHCHKHFRPHWMSSWTFLRTLSIRWQIETLPQAKRHKPSLLIFCFWQFNFDQKITFITS